MQAIRRLQPQADIDLGLNIVHKPESPTADLIFIHGLNGHFRRTWTNGSEGFWLEWLKQYLPDVRVWTYGYNAKMTFGSRYALRSRDALEFNVAIFLSELLRCRSVRILF
jgi:hypothetical protein